MFLDDKSDSRNIRAVGRFSLALAALIACCVMLAGLTFNVSAQTMTPDPSRHDSDTVTTAPITPTSELTTGSITRSLNSPIDNGASRLEATGAEAAALSISERYFVIGVLALCFAVMSVGAISLWRRSYGEIARAAARKRTK